MVKRLGRGEDLAGALAAERLGVPGVVFVVMAAAAPLTVVAGTIPVAYAVTGNVGLPVAFAAVGAVLAVFSVGYVAMSRHLPHSGAFYAYVAHGLGRVPAVAAAWVSLAAYNLLTCSLYGAIGAAVSPLVVDGVGVDLPWWVYALAAWALVAALGVARIDVNGAVLAVLLVAEVTLVVVFDIAYLAHPGDGAVTVGGWSPAELTRPGVGAILAIAVLGFTGFESAVVFAEESRRPRRTIPAATYLALAVIAALYGVTAWALATAAGPGRIVTQAQDLGPDVVFALAAQRLGGWASTAGHALFATSIIAAMISFHATTARYTFALGREGVLPRAFGRTSTSGAPKAGSLAQSGTALVVILAFAVAGTDPVLTLYYLCATTGTLGILILLVLAGLAVLGFFATDVRGEGVWRTVAAPAVSLAGLGLMLVLVLANVAALLGVEESSPLRWGLPAVFLAVAAAGTGWGMVLRVRRPDTYRAIGHGPRAALTAPAAASARLSLATSADVASVDALDDLLKGQSR